MVMQESALTTITYCFGEDLLQKYFMSFENPNDQTLADYEEAKLAFTRSQMWQGKWVFVNDSYAVVFGSMGEVIDVRCIYDGLFKSTSFRDYYDKIRGFGRKTSTIWNNYMKVASDSHDLWMRFGRMTKYHSMSLATAGMFADEYLQAVSMTRTFANDSGGFDVLGLGYEVYNVDVDGRVLCRSTSMEAQLHYK